MESERKVKIVSLVAVIVAVIGLTIAFAAMSRTLYIHGSGTMDPVNWDIYFENLSSPVLVGEASVSGSPNLATKGAEITNLNATLKQPNDSVTYTVDITNDGDVNAEISQINLPSLTNAQSQLFEFSARYTNEYENGHTITVGDMLYAGETRNITIVFKYKDIADESLLPSSPEAINLSYSINYIQSNRASTTTTAAPVVNNCTSFETKSTYSVGDVIALCNSSTGKSEDFYVISDNGETVTALAKYNLLVGDAVQYDSNGSEKLSQTAISNSDPEYGIQSSRTGASFETFIITGAMAFANIVDENTWWGYWAEDSGSHALRSSYGSSYPAWVFNSNSNLWTPVQNYQTYLTTILGKTSVSVTLMSYEQADALKTANGGSYPSWVYSSSYWLGSAYDYYDVRYVHFYGYLGNYGFDDDGGCGVRPVITISKSDI